MISEIRNITYSISHLAEQKSPLCYTADVDGMIQSIARRDSRYQNRQTGGLEDAGTVTSLSGSRQVERAVVMLMESTGGIEHDRWAQ